MPKERTLADLYVRGREVVLDDGSGEPVAVWLQKLTPVQRTTAMRKADAAKARVLTCRRDKGSERYLSVYADVADKTKEEQVALLLGAERVRIAPMVEDEMATEEEWSNENYLQGLRDAWRDGLAETYVDDPDDPEAQRVYGELKRFIDSVNKRIDRDLKDHELALGELSEQEREDALVNLAFRNIGDLEWLMEYHRCEIWLGVREVGDHSRRMLEHRSDVDELSEEAFDALAKAMRELTVEPVEGKGSAVSPPSSNSSEPSDRAETEPSSGPLAATA